MYKVLLFLLYLSTFLIANEKVVLQLKWFHQFQFAGYYAAKEKGFYEELGLDVEIRQRDINYNNIQQVIDDEAQYGVADSVLLLYKEKNEPVVIVSPIFQHSPSVLMSLKKSQINSVYDLNNKDVLFYENDTDGFSILAMLKRLDIKPNLIRKREKNDYLKLMNEKVDLSPGYLSNEPYFFKEKNIDINIINPMNYGFDLYGDMLFTNSKEAKENPNRVKRFKEATLKGWEYALDNKDEIIKLINQKYNPNKSIEHLRFEANAIERVISKDTIPLGTVDEGRVKFIYQLYKEYGLSKNELNVKDFIFDEYNKSDKAIKFTKEEQEFLEKNKVLKVQNLKAFPPFNFNEDKALGFTIDYVNLLAEYLGVEIEFITGTWAEHLEMIKSGELDIIPHMAITEARKEYVDFSSHIHIYYTPSIAVRKDLNINSLEDLNGKKLAVLNKSFLHEMLKSKFPKIVLYPVPTPSDVLELVSNGMVDAGIDNLSLLEYYIQKNWLSNLKTIRLDTISSLKKTPLHMAVKKDNKVLKSLLEKANEAIAYNELFKLKEKWINIKPKNSNKIDFTTEEFEYLTKKQELKVCIDPNWMPYEKIEEGKHIGITADYMKIFREKLPIPVKLQVTKSWEETLSSAKQRKCDLVTIMIKTKEREKYFNFSKEYLSSPLVIATKINEPFINDITNVLDKTFGIVKGYAYKEELEKEYPGIKIVDVKSVEDGLEKIDNEEIFGFIDSLPVVGYEIQKNYAGNLKVTGKVSREWSFSIASRNDEPQLNEIFSKLLTSIPLEKHNSILHKWISVKFEESIDYTKLVWFFIVFFLIFLIIVQNNRSIKEINEKMKKYLDLVDENVLTSTTDKRGIIINVSQAFCDISGYSKSELLGQNHRIIRHPDMDQKVFDTLWETISNGKIWKGELKNRKKDGTFYWVDATITPNFDESGQIVGYTAIRHEITDKKKIEEISIGDELTTLYNKRYFNEMFEKEINRAKRDEHLFGFMIFDIDHFKQYNDNYGHQKGDEVLELVGKTIKKYCKRSSDIPFRIGGEEFGIIFNPHFKEIAIEFANNMCHEIENLKIEHKYSTASSYVTVSIGLYVERAENIKTSKEIYKLADDALYDAKDGGRNQVKFV